MLSGWRLIAAAGAGGFLFAGGAEMLVHTYAPSTGGLSTLLAGFCGALGAAFAAKALTWRRLRDAVSEQNGLFDTALNSMSQGFCLFDAEDRLQFWNDRWLELYKVDPNLVWRGCTVDEVRDARHAAGTLAADPPAFRRDRVAGVKKGQPFSITAELVDGRIFTVSYRLMPGGGWLTLHEDVTERVKAERDLEHTRVFLDSVVENTPSPIIVKSIPDMRYMLVNRAAEVYLGIDRKQIIGKTPREVMPASAAEKIEETDRKLIETGEVIYADEHSVETPGNGARIVTSTRLSVRGAGGNPHYLISLIHDVTERKRDQQRLIHLARHDVLTDLPNRLAFNAHLGETIDRASASGGTFAVLCVDLDRFKAVNDAFGHVVGDSLLREIAHRMQDAAPGALLARTGGDEFAVIAPAGPQPQSAEALATRLSAALDNDFEGNERPLHVGMTIGVALFPQDGADSATLMANANAALYRAKQEARGTIRFFEPAMDAKLREARVLQQDLRSAIALSELTLHYQPQARIDGAITGFEALARWQHPRLGSIPPSTFIPLAEESGSIVALGEWILRAACREAASWPQPLRIGVNLSPVQFHHSDLPRLVHEVLLETGLRPDRLELEITEGVLIGDFDRALSVLRRLKNLGVRVAMDDFGTGYSSLSYLQSFPFDKMKIDRAFITNVCHSEQAAAIVRSIIALGHGLTLPVLAEGVETQGQLDFLAREGCDEVQGYLIGKPKPVSDYADLTKRDLARPTPLQKRVAAR